MAGQTSAESPAALRTISTKIGEWVDRLGVVWVEAEVAQVTRRQGTCFLTLKDLVATVSVDATCPLAVLESSPAPVTPGARVVVQAKPAYFVPRGSLSLQIREIRLQGEGVLLARLEQLKHALAAEGLFETRYKKPLPFLPRTVGLITARDSAAERDVIQIAKRRWPGVRFAVQHSAMQGNAATSDIMHALGMLDQASGVDVIIIARGGGSVADLLPFSDEALVRAAFRARTPVVSAIGHEPDVPLLDLVADVRAATPTDAAKQIVPDVAEQIAGLGHLTDRLSRAISSTVETEQQRLSSLRSRPALAAPISLIDSAETATDELRQRARLSLYRRIERADDEVAHHLARVRALSPLATIERGYAVVTAPDGTIVNRVAQAVAPLTIQLVDGALIIDSFSEAPVKE